MVKSNNIPRSNNMARKLKVETVVPCMIMKEKRKEIFLSRKVILLLFLTNLILVDGGKDL